MLFRGRNLWVSDVDTFTLGCTPSEGSSLATLSKVTVATTTRKLSKAYNSLPIMTDNAAAQETVASNSSSRLDPMQREDGASDGTNYSSSSSVQIHVLQPGHTTADVNILAVQTLLGSQDIAATQMAVANLQSSDQQKVLAAAQQQILPSLGRSSLQPIVVPSPVQTVTVVSANTSSHSGKIPAHYVTPFTIDTQALSQAGVSQPGTAIGGIPTAHVVTTGYDFNIAQAQAMYSQQVMASSGGADPRGLTAIRASPQTIKWLFENFETAEGVSLQRSTLYNHYLRHCAANKIDAINASSFRKLIRSVFIGLKT